MIFLGERDQALFVWHPCEYVAFGRFSRIPFHKPDYAKFSGTRSGLAGKGPPLTTPPGGLEPNWSTDAEDHDPDLRERTRRGNYAKPTHPHQPERSTSLKLRTPGGFAEA